MILRRPYAILIKYFRLIHLVITGLFFYFMIQSRNIYGYLKLVIKDTVNRYDALSYINYGIYFYMFVAIVLCLIIYFLLKYKDKPRRIYVFTIVGYMLIGIFLYILYIYMQSFSNIIIDQKVIRLYKDIFTITLFFQYYIIIVMLIRGLGFDIKKFDFNRDKQELNISDEDSEEVEVNLGIDTTNVVRGIRKQKREFGYFYREYKIYIITIVVVIILISSYKIYTFLSDKLKIYNEKDVIGEVYKLAVRNSYYKISDDNSYVAVNLAILKYGKIDKFNTGNLKLVVAKKEYFPDKNICYKFNSLGNCYKTQYIKNEFDDYLVVYQVDSLNIYDAYLVYSEGYDNTYKVKLSMESIN